MEDSQILYVHTSTWNCAKHQQCETRKTRENEPLRPVAHAEEEARHDGALVAVLHDSVDDVDIAETERGIFEGRSEDLRNVRK